jgi:cytoskeletal protein CcmA (bactofilin family)
MTMNEGKRTLIEEGTVLKGTLTSSCPVVVLGRLEGEMTGPSVDVAESGVLSGRAKVTALRSRGELAGEFDAETVELSGRVRDKTIIRAQSLEVKLERTDGRLEVMFGECELAVGEAPDKAAAIREATSGAPRAATPAPQPAATAPQPAPSTEGTEGGEVTAEADASPSARNVRRGKRPDDSARHADST